MDKKVEHTALSQVYAAAIGSEELAGGHLGNCTECQGNSDWIAQLLEFGGQEARFEPPEAATAHAFQAFRAEKPSLVKFAKEILATLVYDSFREASSPAGMRQRDFAARQTLFEAEGLQLDLKIQMNDVDRGSIIGQVVSESDDVAVAELEIAVIRNGEPVDTAKTNPLGEFMFGDLARGEYEVQVQFGEKLLRLPKVPLGKQ